MKSALVNMGLAALLAAALLLTWSVTSDQSRCGEAGPEVVTWFSGDIQVVIPEANIVSSYCASGDLVSLSSSIRIDGNTGFADGRLLVRTSYSFQEGTIGSVVLVTPERGYPAHEAVAVTRGDGFFDLYGHEELGEPGLRHWTTDVPVPLQSGYVLNFSVTGPTSE